MVRPYWLTLFGAQQWWSCPDLPRKGTCIWTWPSHSAPRYVTSWGWRRFPMEQATCSIAKQLLCPSVKKDSPHSSEYAGRRGGALRWSKWSSSACSREAFALEQASCSTAKWLCYPSARQTWQPVLPQVVESGFWGLIPRPLLLPKGELLPVHPY